MGQASTESTQKPGLVRAVRLFVIGHLPWVVLLTLLVVLVALYAMHASFQEHVNEIWSVASSGDQQAIRDYLKGWGAWGPIASVGLMLLQGIFAPIPASVIQLANGVVFGVFWGAILNLIGQMAGATAAFYISRSLGRAAAEKLVGKFNKQQFVEDWLMQWGSKALFVIRAIPGMPSDFVSYLLGLTRMPARTYLLVSFFGYIPQSFAYSWLGDRATEYFWWIVLGGFLVSFVIGGVVWIVRKFMYRSRSPEAMLTAEYPQDR